MVEALVPCPQCTRHIRASEASCPFCKTDVAGRLADRIVPGTGERLTRAAAFAFTASLAVTGCSAGGGTVTTGDGGARNDSGTTDDSGSPQPVYGAPAPNLDGGPDGSSKEDAGTDAADAGFDTGGVQPAYGAPAYGQFPVDSGSG